MSERIGACKNEVHGQFQVKHLMCYDEEISTSTVLKCAEITPMEEDEKLFHRLIFENYLFIIIFLSSFYNWPSPKCVGWQPRSCRMQESSTVPKE